MVRRDFGGKVKNLTKKAISSHKNEGKFGNCNCAIGEEEWRETLCADDRWLMPAETS